MALKSNYLLLSFKGEIFMHIFVQKQPTVMASHDN